VRQERGGRDDKVELTKVGPSTTLLSHPSTSHRRRYFTVTHALRRRARRAPGAPLDVTPPATPVTRAFHRRFPGALVAPLDVTPAATPVTRALRRRAHGALVAPLDVTALKVVDFEDKLEVLRAEIEDAIATIEAGFNEELVSIVKLFY